MIVPENISSEGWDWYEENQIDWDYIDHLHFVGGKECWNSEEMESSRVLETTELAYKQHEDYWKDSEECLYCLQCHNEDGLNWEEEYEYFLEECERLELKRWEIYSTDTQQLHLQGELLKHKRYQKKRKHKKDHKTWVWHNDGCWWEIQFKTHKHKRAEKVFTEEEVYGVDPYHSWEDLYKYELCENYIDCPSCEGHCAEGYCIRCDWCYKMEGLSWDDANFIEYWDYYDVWKRQV